MAWTLVTPSSRGIGAALVRHLLTSTSVPVVATARSDIPSVRSLLLQDIPTEHHARLDVQRCDVEDESSIAQLASHCNERYQQQQPQPHANKDGEAATPPPHLRLALFTPGMLIPERGPDKIDADSALATLKLNLLAPMLLLKHFAPFLPQRRKKGGSAPSSSSSSPSTSQDLQGLNPNAAIMALMSARVGSISDNGLGGWFSYRASKAGVNQVVRTLDNYLKTQSRQSRDGNELRAISVGLHPGTVKTDLSREFWASTPKEKLFAPEFAAERLLGVLRDLPVEEGRGRCWDWKGEEIPP